MMNKKGQAALEFIMTYGWAILVVLVAVGALAYFGVLSPDKFLPSKCTMQAGVACLDHKVNSSWVAVRLQNGLGYDITAVSVKAGNCGNYPGTVNSQGSAALANGEAATYNIPCAAVLSGTRYSQQINVSYTVTDSGIGHNNVGDLTTRIG